MGFFTDTSVCIGCKACEVACKEWNGVPDDGLDLLGMSYDNTGALTANSWRHVAFIEQPRRPARSAFATDRHRRRRAVPRHDRTDRSCGDAAAAASHARRAPAGTGASATTSAG